MEKPLLDNVLPVLDYQALFRMLPSAYFVIRANDPEYTFVDVGEAHAEMTGVPIAKTVGRPLFEVYPDISEQYKRTGVSELQEAFREVIKTKKAVQLGTFRYDIADESGDFIEKYWQPTYYPLLGKTGKVEFIVSASRDVTDQVHKSRELHELEERLEHALDIGKVGSWTWDIERDVVKTNSTLASIFGVDTTAASKGLPLSRFISAIYEEDRERVTEEIRAAVETGSRFESEYRTTTDSGEIRWVLARGRLKAGKNGRTATFPGVIVDITERHEFEAQLEDARVRELLNRKEAELLQKRNEELEVLSRSKDEFVALASHQLRTPATAVKQYLGMVLQGYVGDISETQTEMLEKAFEGNERQIQIINQILNAARVDTGRLVMSPAPVDARALVYGIVEEMRPRFELRGHELKARLSGAPVTVMADMSYLRMAIENVLNNAGAYTPAPGHIAVELKKTGKEVRVMISDDGVGIKKSDIGKLFAKFSRIHNPLSVQVGGSGIGLYLTAEILRLHHGSIEVDSKINKGTTFTIVLPLLRSGGEEGSGSSY